jgi:hypothetical protein
MAGAPSSRFNISKKAKDFIAKFMGYYTPLERQARLTELEKRVAIAKQKRYFSSPPLENVDEISVPTDTMRQLATFISYMNNLCGVEERKPFFAILFNQNDMYAFIGFVLTTETISTISLPRFKLES